MDLNEDAFVEAAMQDIYRRMKVLMEALEAEYPGFDYSVMLALPRDAKGGPVMLAHIPAGNVPGAHMLTAAAWEVSKLRCEYHKIAQPVLRDAEREGRKYAKTFFEGLKSVEKPR